MGGGVIGVFLAQEAGDPGLQPPLRWVQQGIVPDAHPPPPSGTLPPRSVGLVARPGRF